MKTEISLRTHQFHIADRVAQHLEIISKNLQIGTRRTRILMGFIIYYLVLIVHPMGRILVRWNFFRNILKMLCHPICNWLYIQRDVYMYETNHTKGTYEKRPLERDTKKRQMREIHRKRRLCMKRVIQKRPMKRDLSKETNGKRHTKETYERDTSKETYVYETRHTKETYERDLWMRPMKETYEKDLWKRPMEETFAKDLWKRYIHRDILYETRHTLKETCKIDPYTSKETHIHQKRPTDIQIDPHT